MSQKKLFRLLAIALAFLICIVWYFASPTESETAKTERVIKREMQKIREKKLNSKNDAAAQPDENSAEDLGITVFKGPKSEVEAAIKKKQEQ